MPLSEYVEGCALLAVTIGAVALAARRIVVACLADLRGAERLLAWALIAALGMIGAHLVPAAAGLLSRGAVVVVALAALTIAYRLPVRESTDPATRAAAPLRSRTSLLAGGFAVIAVGSYMIALAIGLGGRPIVNIDTATFHLPGVARWIESGSIWQIDQFLPDQAQGYYPASGNVAQLAAVLPFDSDFLVRFVDLPFFAVTGIGVFAAARRLAAPAGIALLVAALALSIPAVTVYVVDSPTPDAVMYAGFAAGIAFGLRHADTGRRSDLVVAALGLGLAFGSRWYGVSSVATLGAVWIAARLAGGVRPRRVLADGVLAAAIVVACGGIWLLRNWAESGNPFFPVRVGVGGLTIFDAPADPARATFGFSIADYLGDWSAWGTYILPALRSTLAAPAALVGAGALAGIALAALRPREPDHGRVLALGAAALVLAGVYAITPYTALGTEGAPIQVNANTRYLVPALLAAAPVCAWVMAEAGRLRPLLGLVAVAAVLDGLAQGADLTARDLALALAGLGVCAALVALAWRLRSGSRRRRPVALATACAVLLGAVVLAHRAEQRALDGRYRDYLPTYNAVLDAPAGTAVGIAGSWEVGLLSPILPAFGDRLDHRVSYVGRFEDGILRAPRDSAGFRAAAADGDYDLLLVGHADLPLGAPTDELAWARAAGYTPLASDDEFTLMRPVGGDGR